MITLPQDLLDLQQKTKKFILNEVIPFENDPRQDAHGPSKELCTELINKAREWNLLTLVLRWVV